MQTVKAKREQPLKALLSEVVDEMNELVPDQAELYRRWNQAQVAASAPGLSKLERQIIRDGQDERSQKDQTEYWSHERQRYASLFRALATHGRLPAEELRELASYMKDGVRVSLRVEVRAGTPLIRYVPEFKTRVDLWAYSILQLAEHTDTGFYVVACKHCGKLVLVQRGGRGRPRTEFCSPAHNNAYGQKTARDKKEKKARARAAARHK
jgi:hypothetical protein